MVGLLCQTQSRVRSFTGSTAEADQTAFYLFVALRRSDMARVVARSTARRHIRTCTHTP